MTLTLESGKVNQSGGGSKVISFRSYCPDTDTHTRTHTHTHTPKFKFKGQSVHNPFVSTISIYEVHIYIYTRRYSGNKQTDRGSYQLLLPSRLSRNDIVVG